MLLEHAFCCLLSDLPINFLVSATGLKTVLLEAHKVTRRLFGQFFWHILEKLNPIFMFSCLRNSPVSWGFPFSEVSVWSFPPNSRLTNVSPLLSVNLGGDCGLCISSPYLPTPFPKLEGDRSAACLVFPFIFFYCPVMVYAVVLRIHSKAEAKTSSSCSSHVALQLHFSFELSHGCNFWQFTGCVSLCGHPTSVPGPPVAFPIHLSPNQCHVLEIPVQVFSTSCPM